MIVQLDTENADRNLTSQVTVLTHTPDASNPMLCQAVVFAGDGSKNLDGTGGNFELEVLVGGNSVQPGPQIVVLGASDTRACFISSVFPVPANNQVLVKLKSPNAGDSDVDTTAYLYDVYPVNVASGVVEANAVQISGDVDAANNLEAQFDGTGLSGDTYPATQAQAGALTVSSAAINTTAASYTLTTGTQSANTYASTAALDGTRHTHTDTAGAMELYYEFNVGNSGIPVSAKLTGALTGINDTLGVYAYNWGGTSWDQVGSLVGTVGSTNAVYNYDLLTAHVGTGSNVGLVRIRFYAGSGLTSATLYVDQLLVSYAQGTTGIANGSTVTLGAATTNANLIGRGWILALGGQAINGSYFYQAKSVTGTATNTNGSEPIFQECAFGVASISADVTLDRCSLGSTLTLTSTSGVGTDTFNMFDSFSAVAGAGTPTLDASALSKTTGLNIRNWAGGLTLLMAADVTASLEVNQGGTQTVTTNGGNLELRGMPKAVSVISSGSSVSNLHGVIGAVTVNGSAGTVNIYGVHGTVTDLSGGNVTINDYGVDAVDIAAIPTTSDITTAIAAMAEIKAIRSMARGKFIIDTEARTITFYAADNTTPLFVQSFSEDYKTRTVA